MRERKIIRTRKNSEREELLRHHLSLRGQLSEALRLCHGKLDAETLLRMCPLVNIDGAIEIGLLIVDQSSHGKCLFLAGPKLEDENCDVTKALNLKALIASCARC